MESLLIAAEGFVREALSAHDGSHDYSHISRVRSAAKSIALEEGLSVDRVQLVEMCALLHDVDDWKYASVVGVQGSRVKSFLEAQGCSSDKVHEITSIIHSIGFKEGLPSSLSRSDAGPSPGGPVMPIEAQVLQDADRLDAIGAIGIARCFTFGGAFKRVLHDPSIPPRVGLTKEQYMSGAGKEHNTTINHFHEKLLLLKDMMKTAAGRRLASQRHSFMEAFLQQFEAEWDGRA